MEKTHKFVEKSKKREIRKYSDLDKLELYYTYIHIYNISATISVLYIVALILIY